MTGNLIISGANLLANYNANTIINAGVNVGGMTKVTAGGSGISISSNDPAVNQLSSALMMYTDPTAANRRLTIGIVEQGIAWRNITLCENGGFVGIGKMVPACALDVAGQINSSMSSTTGIFTFGTVGNGKYLQYDGTQFNLNGGPLHVAQAIYSTAGLVVGDGGNTGTCYFGTLSNGKYLNYDGTNFNLVGGTLYSSSIVATGDIYAAATATTGNIRFGTSGTKYLGYDGTNFSLTGGQLITDNNIIAAKSVVAQNGYLQTILSANTGTIYFGSSGSQYLNYDGSNFNFYGATLVVNGAIYDTGVFTVGYAGTAGTIYFGNTGTKSLVYDGTNFNMNGGPLYVNSQVRGTDIFAVRATNQGVVFLGSDATHYLQFDGTNFNMNGAPLIVNSGAVSAGGSLGINVLNYAGSGSPYQVVMAQGNPNYDMMSISGMHFAGNWAGVRLAASTTGVVFDFRNDSNGYKASGGTAWIVTSDARIKNVTGDYTSGLDAVCALKPIRFTYKGNNTHAPPSHFSDTINGQEEKPEGYDEIIKTQPSVPYGNSMNAGPAKAGTEYIGLVAQDAEQSMPELFLKEKGYIDGVAVDDMRNADYSPLIFALVNAVKELNAEIVALKAKLV
jgi:hypothetical protein